MAKIMLENFLTLTQNSHRLGGIILRKLMSRLCSMKEIPNLLLTACFMSLIKYLLNGSDAISPSLCKILLWPKIGYDLKMTWPQWKSMTNDPLTKSWAVTFLFLGVDSFLPGHRQWLLSLCISKVANLLNEMFDTQPCDSVYGKYCKVNDQHYPEVGLKHSGVP